MAEQDKDKEPVKEQPKPVKKAVETSEYKEFTTLNGAVRRDMK